MDSVIQLTNRRFKTPQKHSKLSKYYRQDCRCITLFHFLSKCFSYYTKLNFVFRRNLNTRQQIPGYSTTKCLSISLYLSTCFVSRSFHGRLLRSRNDKGSLLLVVYYLLTLECKCQLNIFKVY